MFQGGPVRAMSGSSAANLIALFNQTPINDDKR
jgi:hypothetical protein